MAKPMYFRVVEGKHVDHKNRVFRKGELVPSLVDLTKIFKNKFERYRPDEHVKPDLPTLDEDTVEEETEEAPTVYKNEAEEEKDPRGANVTSDFPEAILNDLLVFVREEKKKTLFFVYDHNELKCTKKGLRTADDVKEFLSDITEGE